MRKIYLSIITILAVTLFTHNVQSNVSPIGYEIIFSTPSTQIITEKQRILALYKELNQGVYKGSMHEILLLSESLFLSENVIDVEMKGDTLKLYFDKKGKLVIKGTFEDVCEVSVKQESWFVEMFRK